jgi:hypothetical protein
MYEDASAFVKPAPGVLLLSITKIGDPGRRFFDYSYFPTAENGVSDSAPVTSEVTTSAERQLIDDLAVKL